MKLQYAKYSLICIFLLAITLIQDVSAQPWLRKAETLYDDGQIEKVPELTDKKKNAIAREQELVAKRLSILSHIYNDNWHEADSAMLKILEYENEYTLLQEDSATEFHYLYESYRTTPIYGVGITGGLNFSQIKPIDDFGTYNLNRGNGEYGSPNTSFQLGLNCMVFLDAFMKGAAVGVEPQFFRTTYKYKMQMFDFANIDFREVQSWFRFPVFVSYSFKLKKRNVFFSSGVLDKMSIYGLGGISASVLLKAYSEPVRTYTDKTHNDIKRSDVDLLSVRNRLSASILLGAGVKYKVKMGNLFFDFKYYKGLNNLVNQKNRFSNEELIYNYYYLDNNFKVNSFVFSVGYQRLIYVPKKKPKKGYNYFQP